MPQFLILDGALLENQLIQGEKLNAQFRSFYHGVTDQEIEPVGPYIFTYPNSTSFHNWYIQNGLNKHWGILIDSPSSFDQIYSHFRKFVCFQSEDDQLLYFRFYDPRVLKLFLLDCDSVQLTEFFGPVEQFICEDEDPAFAIVFSLDQGNLLTDRVPAQTLFSGIEKEVSQSIPPAESNPGLPPKKEPTFTEQPLPYARLEANPESFQLHLSRLPPGEIAAYFSDVEHYYGEGGNGEWFVFSFPSPEKSLLTEKISEESLQIRLQEADIKQKENQKAYSDSILKSREKKKNHSVLKEAPKNQIYGLG